MMKSLLLSVLLVFSSITSPTFARSGYPNLIDLCRQTPGLTAWGEYLYNNPDIYHQYYAERHDMSFFFPSNEALEKYAKSKNYTIQERGDAMADQNLFIADVFNPASYINTRADTRTVAPKRRSHEDSYMRGEPITLRTAAKGLNQRNIPIGMVFDKNSRRLEGRSFEHAPDPISAGIEISSGLGVKSQVEWGGLLSEQGIVYVVDRILEFPETVSNSLEKTGSSEFQHSVEAAGFQEKYDTADQITIFAPIDGSYNSSCSMTTAAVEAHVVYGAALYNSVLKDGTEFQTCQGKKLKITVKDGDTYVSGVKIVERDVITLNGVIHTLERPLVDSDYDDYEGTTTTEATPMATEYRTYYNPSTTIVEVQVTGTPVTTSVPAASTISVPAASTTSVPAASTTTPLAGTNATATPVQFLGSASILKMVDMRVTLGTLVFALAVFMF